MHLIMNWMNKSSDDVGNMWYSLHEDSFWEHLLFGKLLPAFFVSCQSCPQILSYPISFMLTWLPLGHNQVMEAAQASTGLSGSFHRGYALQNVNHIAHLSGALIGVLLVWLLSRLTYQPSDQEIPSRRKKTGWTENRHFWFEFPQGTNCMVMSCFILVCVKVGFFQSNLLATGEGTPKAILHFQETLS